MSHLSDLRNRINTPARDFLSTLTAGEHGCIFFASKKVMQDLQFAFVKSGLEDNWGVVYATSTESVEQIRDAMQKYGIDQRQEANGSLIIVRGEDLYKNPENPDLDAWLNTARSVSQNFIAKGKKAVRVAADLSSYFLSKGLTKQWFDLEYALEKKLSLPMSILCAYDTSVPELWDTDVLKYYTKINDENKEYVDAHSFVIFASKDRSTIFTI